MPPLNFSPLPSRTAMASLTTLTKRAGGFSPPDPDRCQHYARFLQNITRGQADAIFGSMFFMVVVLLVIASGIYERALRTGNKATSNSKASIRIRQKCLLWSILCCVIITACVVMECFAAFSIQFCDGEDLMMLYWGFWSLLQVGSLIAILGIVLNQAYGLQNRAEPPWATALGTPVLVIAAFGHFLLGHFEEKATPEDKENGMQIEEKCRCVCTVAESLSPTRSSSPTQAPSAIGDGQHIGYTMDGQALYAFPLVFSGNSKEQHQRIPARLEFSQGSRRRSSTSLTLREPRTNETSPMDGQRDDDLEKGRRPSDNPPRGRQGSKPRASRSESVPTSRSLSQMVRFQKQMPPSQISREQSRS